MSFNSINLVELCRIAYENRRAVAPISNLRGVKVFIYHITTILFSPKRRIVGRVIFINGKGQNGFNLEIPNANKVYYGNVYNGKNRISDLPTFYCNSRKIRRLMFFFKWTIQFLISKNSIRDYSLWIELCSLNDFLNSTQITEIIGRGHYDEFSTWFGQLSKIYGFKYTIYQHGVEFDDMIIPHKIVCNHVFAFDNYSIDVFKKLIIENSDCLYSIYDFPSSVSFVRLNEKKKDIKYIGVAEQCNQEWTNKLISALNSIEGLFIIIMRHPLSTYHYEILKGCVESSKKYYDIDFMITEHSTIALDYYRAKSPAKVIYTSNLIKKAFEEYPFVYAEGFDSVLELIKGGQYEASLYKRR